MKPTINMEQTPAAASKCQLHQNKTVRSTKKPEKKETTEQKRKGPTKTAGELKAGQKKQK